MFVGLLAAAFAFLYGELSRFVIRIVEIGSQKEEVMIEMELRDKEVYRGDKGEIEFLSDYMRSLGRVVGDLFPPLMPYVLSVSFLLVGYGLDIEFCVVVGVVLLVEAFLLCGIFLGRIFCLTIRRTEEHAEYLEEELLEVLEK